MKLGGLILVFLAAGLVSLFAAGPGQAEALRELAPRGWEHRLD